MRGALPFDHRTYRQLFRRAFADHPSTRRRRILRVALVAIPLLFAINTVCLWLDHLLFPGFRRVRIRRPLFIVGHARSGTTLMHSLATLDREHMSWFATWELFLPAIVQRRLVHALARLDAWLGAPLARRLRALEDRIFARGRDMHPLGLTRPEEDEFLLLLGCTSPSLAMLFPYQSDLTRLARFDELPREYRHRVLGGYRELVRRQLYLRGPEKHHLSKNPTFSGKMRTLLEIFPDARFAVMERHPEEAIPSLLKLMARNWRMTDCDRETIRRELRELAELSLHTYTYTLEVADALPPDRVAVVDYRELVADPVAVFEKVWPQLGYRFTPEFRARLEEAGRRERGHESRHRYRFEDFDLDREELRRRLAPLYDRFSWER